jgi:glycosyltransferase involved in cell wall biosynthesis
MWTCCQLGAREHYAVPRALYSGGMLTELITDLWIPRLTGRFHPSLSTATVTARNIGALTFELKAAFARENGWKLIGRRNEWFQQRAVARLTHSRNGSHDQTIFAYSYAAEHIFRFARERGWRTVLGQIDPGPAEERRISHLTQDTHSTPAPEAYWDRWRTECALADWIVVNSNWSRDALLGEGVPAEKIRVIPLAYETANHAFERQYPREFRAERRLRVLFLGQINLRKGVGQLLDAVKLLTGEHIEFWFVGPTQIHVPQELRRHPQIRWFGVAPRAAVDRYYKDADVFILPTLSDGFGLTQLEAQSWKLPVIASRYCGEVVRDGVNGVVLEEVSARAIADVLVNFLRSPETLEAMSMKSGIDDRFSLGALATSLHQLLATSLHQL